MYMYIYILIIYTKVAFKIRYIQLPITLQNLPYRTGVAIWCGDDLAPLFQVNSGIPRKDLVSNMTKHNYTVLADIHASTLQFIAVVLKNKKETC